MKLKTTRIIKGKCAPLFKNLTPTYNLKKKMTNVDKLEMGNFLSRRFQMFKLGNFFQFCQTKFCVTFMPILKRMS